MNQPRTVINYINIAHFIDHYAMLVFAAAVIVIAPVFNMSYAELLPYATPGFVAFGAGSLLTGWLGDRWSRRHMMVVFFIGIGLAMMAVGLTQTPQQLGVALLAVGLFAAIYHPVGTAMLVAHAEKLGREVGMNGVWGNLGVASSALVTGIVCQYFGWRWAFLLPGLVTLVFGLMFAASVKHEARNVRKAAQQTSVRVSKEAMWRVIAALAITIIASSTTFNAFTVAMPKLFAERLSGITANTALLGVIVAGTYVFGAVAQYIIGHLLDRHSLKTLFLPLALVLAPLLYFGASLSGVPLVLICIGIVICLFGQVTVNDAMIGKYTSDEWRARAYSVRYFLGFTAAGASVGLVATLHDHGGFALMLQALAALCALVIVGAICFPQETRQETKAPA
ncbi:putative sialic acid transporter [compost metagenome]